MTPLRSRHADERGPIALAEKILALLDEGRFTATYKYAVLLALMDVCLENTSATGAAPEMITTRQLAEAVVDIYWPHTAPFRIAPSPKVLLQNAGRRESQAEIIRAIAVFRHRSAPDPSTPLLRARTGARAAFERLLRTVEWKLIEMPLPRLQRFGRREDRFLYSIGWDQHIRVGEVREYQKGSRSSFDNRIHLAPGVGDGLVVLNGLLRPLIHRQWAGLVARLNGLEESRLEEFLFGPRRIPLDPVRLPLQELQADRCFYCGERLRDADGYRPHVDHFVPWARYPNNAIENLVVAHERCNTNKRDHLAAADHVERWRSRFGDSSGGAGAVADIASRAGWETDPERSLGVARGVYLPLPEAFPLWLRTEMFVPCDREQVASALADSHPSPDIERPYG